MKPIEPGCLVMLVNAAPHCKHEIGRVFTVVGPQRKLNPITPDCLFCSSRFCWPLDDGDVCCTCGLIRIDDDPDAVTEPEQREVEA